MAPGSGRIVIIGSGNVASHLARGFAAAGCSPCQVWSRDAAHARRLADEFVGCSATDRADELITDADLYVIAVSDAAVAPVAAGLPQVSGTVVHTSGSVDKEVLAPMSERYGVLYPLQTFSRQAPLDLSLIPLFTEGSDAATLAEIDRYAALISPKVQHADADQRRVLHIAGVLSCNFVNYLWGLAADELSAAGYTLEVVRPLIEATLEKAMTIGPTAAQTGPAARGDLLTVSRHTLALPAEAAEVYALLSQQILRHRRS